MAKKDAKLPFRVGKIGLFFKNKKKKAPVKKKDKPFVGEIPPACIEAILNIRHLMVFFDLLLLFSNLICFFTFLFFWI